MSVPSRGTQYDVEAARYDVGSHDEGQRRSTHAPVTPEAPGSAFESALKRRMARSSTSRSLGVTPPRPRLTWSEEPQVTPEPSKTNGWKGRDESLREECEITVVEFGEDNFEMFQFDSTENLVEFLEREQEDWAKCRWINVHGLNWDVIRILARYKKLHRFAISDLVSETKLTKTEWYSDHAYITLTLQKLIHLQPAHEHNGTEESDDDSVGEGSEKSDNGIVSAALNWLFSNIKAKNGDRASRSGARDQDGRSQVLNTLQRYHGGHNRDRIAYMEAHSTLAPSKLTVIAEKVSIFLTADNTVISFSHSSAKDIEISVLHQLTEFTTLFRKACDASVVTQGILNAIIDLALPVTEAFQNAIGALELDMLTQPSVKNTASLYVITSEIEMIRSSVSPIFNIVKALREQKDTTIISDVGHAETSTNNNNNDKNNQNREAQSTVRISSAAQTYLRDAEDHITLITDSLDSMRTSCTNMIDLIFNTVSARQNESIKQLTIVTIVFLPMSFLTSYFSVPFKDFSGKSHRQGIYWAITLPIAVLVILFLMKDTLSWYFVSWGQRRGISKSRTGRMKSINREAVMNKMG